MERSHPDPLPGDRVARASGLMPAPFGRGLDRTAAPATPEAPRRRDDLLVVADTLPAATRCDEVLAARLARCLTFLAWLGRG